MNSNIIDIENLHKTYANGFEALKGISLQIRQGAFFGLLGPNGAGKSTLINSMVGLVKPTSGSIRIAGFDIARNTSDALMNIGVVAQEILCDPFLSVYEMLSFQSGYYGLKNNDEWIEEIIDSLGLSEKRQTPCRLLSGGMKRRVMVAQALVHKPPVIVLDEPTAGVDVQLRNQLWQFIEKLHQKGHTIVLTTHYLEEAQNLCSEIAIINHGKIVTTGTTDQLLDAVEQNTVRFRLVKGQIPEKLRCRVLHAEAQSFVIGFSDAMDLGAILETLRTARCEIGNLQTSKATLGDLFIQVTQAN